MMRAARVRVLAVVSLIVALVTSTLISTSLLFPSSAATVESVPLTFGKNTHGQLGDGSTIDTVRATPGPVSGLTDVIDIGGGREHVIALRADGTVSTWGSDQFGQLGNGSAVTSNQSTPVTVPGLSGVIDVDDGHYHSIALKSDGTAWTWGFGSLGQLGNASTSSNVPTPVQFGALTDVTAVFGGRDMTYVLREDGTVWCAGGNASGECGDDSYTAKIDWPVQVPGITGVADMAGGRNHAIALKSDGTVWTWGLNVDGQLGDGTTVSRAEPSKVAGLSNVIDVAAGADHSVAVTGDGHVYTWGWGGRSQLGLGDTDDRLTPTLVPGISDAAISEAGRDHTLIITKNGQLVTWGENSFQQTGNSSGAVEVMTPYTVPNLTGIVAAAGGQTYSVVLQSTTSGPGPVLVDGFNTGLSAWTGGGAFRLDSTLAPPGGAAPSLRAALTDRRASAWRALPQPLDRGCASVEVRLESVTTGVGLLRLRSSTGVGVAEVAVARNRSLRLRSELTGTVVGMSQKVPLNQWHRVGVCVVNDAGNGDELAVTYDGVELGVAATTAAPVGQIQIGSARRATAVFNLDDVEVTE